MRTATFLRPLGLLFLLTPAVLVAQTTQVQVVHNSPDPAASVVDIYINGALAIDDLAFRKATPYLVLPANVNLDVAVAPGTSMSAAEALAVFSYTLMEGERYQLIATGVLDPAAFAPNPNGASTAFTLVVNDRARLGALPDRTKTLVGHGAPDAPAVDVYARGHSKLATLAYPDLRNSYLRLEVNNYIFDVYATESGAWVGSYRAPGAIWGTGGLGGVVLASGFLNPAANQGGPSLGLLAVSPTGQTSFLTPVPAPMARTAPLALRGAYPNPFNPTTQLRFDLATEATVSVAVYDLVGREVLTLAPQAYSAGAQQVTLDGTALATGLYMYRLQAVTDAETFVQTGRLTLLK